jgi:hypothetical protein
VAVNGSRRPKSDSPNTHCFQSCSKEVQNVAGSHGSIRMTLEASWTNRRVRSFRIWRSSRGLKAEVELFEGLDVSQIRQLQPALEIALPSCVGFGVHHIEQEVGMRRSFFAAFSSSLSTRGIDRSQLVKLRAASVVRSCSARVITRLRIPNSHKVQAADDPPLAHCARCG